ncbi:non-hydrolyzing UDP-N-acetylglucosamine 2-epimerase [Lacrimispora amygdalina]|uniref:non-hydrolyzing UDP-N-acetylglucosamine 2-epimerase n=1 Tax=Lacrimispora amygdalina TaxID=253257 RepID=UPI000BE3E2BD|nr:UDP-N-acetylglucosamine 2-epimerase (non-hydrolyzing) [Lacrimispora amygdalina]
MKNIMLVFGTRPEAVKMCPLVKELKRRNEARVCVCVTGQHKSMLKQVLEAFSINPDYDLSIMKEKQTLFEITVSILNNIRVILEKEKPDVVLVHGDTSTAFACALACFYLHIPVGHVEAGLRTYDLYSPYPEEFNRQAIGIMAEYHFAPTEKARENLLREGKKSSAIFVTGNTGIDALKTTVREDYNHDLLKWSSGSRLILLTAHRRENLGDPMRQIFQAVRRITEDYPDVKVIYPIHLNPLVREIAGSVLAGEERIRLIEPLDVVDFHNFLARAALILTDSGGIQEEAPGLGIPVVVLRTTTERPEGIESGALVLAGIGEKSIYDCVSGLLSDKDLYERMSRAGNPYGDGKASGRIADILLR